MDDILALSITVLSALLVLCVLAGMIYGVCRMIRDAQKKDNAIEEYRKRFGG